MSALPPFCTRDRFPGRLIDIPACTFPARIAALRRLPDPSIGRRITLLSQAGQVAAFYNVSQGIRIPPQPQVAHSGQGGQ